MSEGVTVHLFLGSCGEKRGQTLAYENVVDWESNGAQVSFESEDGVRVISNFKYIIRIPAVPEDNGITS